MPSVVCVDDDPLFQEMVAGAAASINASCVGVSTIAEAKTLIPSASPDVVIIDGLLPDGSGVNLIRSLRQELGFAGKIVFASAFFKDLRSFQKLRAVGTDRILQKPIDAQTLGQELASMVPQPASPQKAPAAPQEPPAAPQEPPAAPPDPRAAPPDPRAMMVAKLAAKYRQGLGTGAMEIEALGERARAGDADARAELALRVHRVAGSAGSFGLPMISELARVVDNRIQAGDPIAECRPGLEGLLDEMRRAASPQHAQGPQGHRPPAPWPWSMLLITEDRALGQRYERELASQRVHVRTASSVSDAVGALQRFSPDFLVFDDAGPTVAGAVDGASPAWAGALAPLLGRLPVVTLTSEPPREPRVAGPHGLGTLEIARDQPAFELLQAAREAFTRPFAGRTVLVADPAPATGRTLAESLEPLGITVLTESDFSGFIKHLSKDPPHVLMLDVELPGMSGFEICRLARADPRFRDVPILCMSGQAGGERGIQAIRAGADELIATPMAPAELVARVTARIKQGSMAEAWVTSLCGQHPA